jgi:hypothetical protein
LKTAMNFGLYNKTYSFFQGNSEKKICLIVEANLVTVLTEKVSRCTLF